MKAEAASGEGPAAAAAAVAARLEESRASGGGESEPSIATELGELSIADPSDAAREADVEEEEQYVQVRWARVWAVTGLVPLRAWLGSRLWAPVVLLC